MSVTLQAQPYQFGWAKNRNQLKLKCSFQQQAGTVASFSWTFATLPSTGNRIVLEVDGFALTFTVGTGNDAYKVFSVAALASKIASNYYIKKIFSTSYTSTSVSLTAASVGYHSVELYVTNANGVRNGAEGTLVASSSSVNGTDQKNKPNYAIYAKIEAVVNDYNVLKEYSCDGMVFHPDSEKNVVIPLYPLAGFIPQPDLPSGSNSVWQLLTNALMKYRVKYGEMWGNDAPMVQNETTTDYYYALCGEEVERYSALGLPDWNSGQNYAFNDSNVFWIIGEDTGKTVAVRQSQPEYLYGFFYKNGIDVGTAVSDSYKVQIELNGVKKNGETVSVSREYNQVNGQVYRIDVSPSTLGSNILWYSVTVKTNWGEWVRIYKVLPDFFEQHIFLLQNKYGLLVPVVCGSLRREIETEAEELYVDRRRYLSISKSGETYTAVMPSLSKEAARRIGKCVGSQYHYMKLKGRYERINIEAGSYKLRDDEDGLVSVEMKIRFVDDQLENITDGPMSRAVTIGIDDIEEHIVSFGEFTDPESNGLIQ